jgi:hypothetical protein
MGALCQWTVGCMLRRMTRCSNSRTTSERPQNLVCATASTSGFEAPSMRFASFSAAPTRSRALGGLH